MTSLKENDESALTAMVGALVVANRNGKKYLLTAPSPRGAKDSWTPAPVLHRRRLSSVSSFCKQVKNTLIPRCLVMCLFLV